MCIAAEQRHTYCRTCHLRSFCLREKVVFLWLLESLCRICIESIIKHHSPARSTLTTCSVSEIKNVFTPGLVTQIFMDRGEMKTLFLPCWVQLISAVKLCLANWGYPGLVCSTKQSRTGETKAELNCRSKSYKADHDINRVFSGNVHKDVGVAA